MAVETNKGDANVSPAQTLTGVAPGVGANLGTNGKARRKRPSSLLTAASSLPSVESSLDEFISRANQTLTDADSWNAAEVAAKQEDESRRENDLLRMRAAEQQLREGEAREQSLRRQLDGLQGRLAEAEARAAVAGSGSQDGVIADLKLRLTRADERIANAEAHAHQADLRAQQLTVDLTAAKNAVPATPSAQFFQAGDSDERVRVAEAKAAKAIAAAKAAAAGLTVSQADLAAIESGLVVPSFDAPKGTNWLAVAGAFIGGLAIMFGVSKVMQMQKTEAAPAAAAAALAPAPAAAPTKPIVTPIEDDKPSQAAAQQPAGDVKAAEATAPVEPAKTETAPVETKTEPAPAAKAEPKHVAAAPKHTAAPAPHKAATAPTASGGLADPFGDGGGAKKAPAKKPADKKPAGGIVDPF
ncbi:MAG: hypothetical protein ABJE66_31830 [Deltaproteobacteria bacterium]